VLESVKMYINFGAFLRFTLLIKFPVTFYKDIMSAFEYEKYLDILPK
jgi:hypothetical protein